MALELSYPVRQEINPNNLFGATSPLYTSLGQKGHPGVDFEAPLYTPIYAPCDGDAFYAFDKDGGDGLWIRTPSNAAPQYSIILWHMPPKTDIEHWIIPTDGSVTRVTLGQHIGWTGNSGFPLESTGPHLHLGVMPCDNTGAALDRENGYLGCVDPMPFFNGQYADQATVNGEIAPIVQGVSNVVTQVAQEPVSVSVKETLIAEILKVVELIKKLL